MSRRSMIVPAPKEPGEPEQSPLLSQRLVLVVLCALLAGGLIGSCTALGMGNVFLGIAAGAAAFGAVLYYLPKMLE